VLQILLLTGTMGSGKTSILGEIVDILESRNIEHAAIDMDWLGAGHPEIVSDLRYHNLSSILTNYQTAGISMFVLARAMERDEFEEFKTFVPNASIVVARVTTDLELIVDRMRLRETGMNQNQYIERVTVLDGLLNKAAIEDFSIANDNRSIYEVALEVLEKALWI
jgi:adenylylsulfate kinase